MGSLSCLVVAHTSCPCKVLEGERREGGGMRKRREREGIPEYTRGQGDVEGEVLEEGHLVGREGWKR